MAGPSPMASPGRLRTKRATFTCGRWARSKRARAPRPFERHGSSAILQVEVAMGVKFKDMMRELFTPKERVAIRRAAAGNAKRYTALRKTRPLTQDPPAKR